MIRRYLHDIIIAIEAIKTNRVQSMLTALGIIFGVAAVISMMAVGQGAKKEIMEQIKLVGANNIVVTAKIQTEKESDTENKSVQKKYSKGLNIRDLDALVTILPQNPIISHEIHEEVYAQYEKIRKSISLIAVTNAYFEIFNHQFSEGNKFNINNFNTGDNVCVIGSEVQRKFFKGNSPVGKSLKCGNIWLKVIGVLQQRNSANVSTGDLGLNNDDNAIFIPIKTMLLRFSNRALITEKSFQNINSDEEEVAEKGIKKNTNQLDKIVIQIHKAEYLQAAANIVSRIILRRHRGVEDFSISVPELLLKQQQKTKETFNIVLGAIAGISLLIGGIGIMNIMLASVLERIKEIGTRMAIGAKKIDIIVQFLAEAVLISVSGGIIGVFLGIVLSIAISHVADIQTSITAVSILISFGVSVSVGILFGYLPAQKASKQNPVECLRN